PLHAAPTDIAGDLRDAASVGAVQGAASNTPIALATTSAQAAVTARDLAQSTVPAPTDVDTADLPIDEETPLTSAMSDDPDRRRAEESMFGSDDDPIERRDDSAGGSSDDNAPMTDAERREADMFGDDDASDRE